MIAAEEILGFQLRAPRADVPDWPLERRRRYLLNPDVPTPLSIDTSVWPCEVGASEAEPENGLRVFTADPTRSGLNKNGILVVISTSAADAESLRREHKIEPQRRVSGPLAFPSFELLGYDVADRRMLSGLMNCGLNDPERSELARRFAPLLNDHGLFKISADAGEFRHECDRLVPEHAPFIVYGLWAEPNWRTS